LEDKTLTGIDVLESQAGYIELPEFFPGSSYMPFSSQLNAFGSPIPYWYYISAGGLQKEQIPSQSDMEKSLGKFISERIRECDYSSYYSEGFEITQGEPTASVSIKNSNVDVKLNMNLQITKGEDNFIITSHSASVKSNLGALYSSAKTVYNKEQKELFLENYGIDNMRLYAPVDGVEITCSPKTWDAETVFSNLKDAIETNTLALTTKNPTTKDEKYFFVSANVNGEAKFINSKNWSSGFEVLPSQGSLLIANPVGTQQGLGILGFCYVPYHFVYNIKYPVLVQVINGDEIFQFPVAVVILGNKARNSLNSSASAIASEFCPYKKTKVSVHTYDTSLHPVDSQISYECFGESCDMGETTAGILTTEFPQCVNGYIVARAKGFEETEFRYSTTEAGSVNIILNKLYNMNLNLKVNGVAYTDKATVYFTSEKNTKIVSYPEQKEVSLSEGNYNLSVYIYKDSSLKLTAATTKECVDVPSSGIAGLLGITDKKCFDVNVPSQIISNVLSGGGVKDNYYILEGDLKNSNSIEINADAFATPSTLEQLQNNYLLFDSSELEVSFK
jgi:hypothetical protein